MIDEEKKEAAEKSAVVERVDSGTTTFVTRGELEGLNNFQIAYKLFTLVDDKSVDELVEIGNWIRNFAANKWVGILK